MIAQRRVITMPEKAKKTTLQRFAPATFAHFEYRMKDSICETTPTFFRALVRRSTYSIKTFGGCRQSQNPLAHQQHRYRPEQIALDRLADGMPRRQRRCEVTILHNRDAVPARLLDH